MSDPQFVYSECPNCETRRGPDEEQIMPCPECGCDEVENVWSDGQRSDARDDAEAVDTEEPNGSK